jgi:hypothetical protein
MSVRYNLEPRTEGRWAVVRVGPKGGQKTIGVYTSQAVALSIQSAMREASRYEAVGR